MNTENTVLSSVYILQYIYCIFLNQLLQHCDVDTAEDWHRRHSFYTFLIALGAVKVEAAGTWKERGGLAKYL